MENFGYVIGRFVRKTVHEGDTIPQKGAVLMDPTRTTHFERDDGYVTATDTTETLRLTQGRIRGAWLAVGYYTVRTQFAGETDPWEFTVEVTSSHTEAHPLDLTLAAPVDIPPEAIEVVRVGDRIRAEEAAETAQNAATSAEEDADRAEGIVSSLEDLETAVNAAETSAAESANSAEQSQTHATTAEGHANTAGEYADTAHGSAQTAEGHANDAASSASDSEISASAASSSADTSASHASQSATSASESAASATAADSSADSATSSASDASTSAEHADGSANSAATSANNASTSADDASAEATTAAGYRDQAEGFRDDSQTILTANEALAFDVDTSVGTAISVGGVVVFYDSGWRDITAEHISNHAQSGAVFIRRTLDTVHLHFDSVVLDSGTGYRLIATLLEAEQAWWSDSERDAFTIGRDNNSSYRDYVGVVSGNQFNWVGESFPQGESVPTETRPSAGLTGTIRYTPPGDLPTTLIGTAA